MLPGGAPPALPPAPTKPKDGMMDVYCPKCGEPWDTDCFHDEAAASATTYARVSAAFRLNGCRTLASYGARCSEPSTATDTTFGLTRQAAAAALYSVLGDDMDGAASELSDLFD